MSMLIQPFRFQTPAAGLVARYWRIYITAVNQDGRTNTAIQEIELHSTIGGTDITGPFTPVMASSSASGFPPAGIVDGNYDSTTEGEWISNTTGPPHWVQLDIGEDPPVVVEIAMWRNMLATLGLQRAPKDFDIQSSNNGVDWTTQRAVVGEDWSSGQSQVYSLT